MLRGRTSAVAVLTLALAALTASGCGGGSSSKGPTAVNWYVFKEPGGAFDAAAAKCTKDSGGRYKVNVVALPTDSDQQRELIVRRLAAKDSSLDVLGMDVNWTAEFAGAGWILPWTGQFKQAAEQGVIPALLASAVYKGQTWVAPFTTNTQVLFYHKDVVKGPPPKTWDEMIQMAQKIGGSKGKIVVQGRRYEGLVVWFNTLVASAGGEIVDRQGNTKLGPPAVKAATVMHDVATKAGTSSISNEKEDTGKDDFKANDIAFMVNYPFVYADVAKDKKALANLGVARYPSVTPGQPSHVTFGGINLGVSKYSKHAQLAFEAAKCIAQPANQIVASEKGGLAPTQAALYTNPRIKKAFPFAPLMQATLKDGVARPVLPAYSDISLAIQDALHPPQSIDPKSAIQTLVDNLKKAKEGKLF
ncbi:MAG: trehalose/maltose transport system substrate-binding protein [Thermoleophilaceae bacterium]|jgi:multiple sugar transport system substrate-binding protein|nr:trehalose/maltose transport system substrate-binding protein [Thermoleophilaceae bacterium]